MSTTYAIRVDESLKNDAAKVAEFYGFDLASVTRAIWSQMVRTHSIPLQLSDEIPNEETLESFRQTEEMIKNGTSKGYKTAEELFEAIGI